MGCLQEMTSATEPLGLAKAADALGGPSEAWWTVESGLEGDGYRKFTIEIEGPVRTDPPEALDGKFARP
jgi:hypothetical protein